MIDDAEPSLAAARRATTLAPYRWKPGQSGNPLGKAGLLARRARQATRMGRDLVEFWCEVMRNPKERTRDRLEASARLAERGFGRALMPVAIESSGNPLDQLQGMLALLTDGELSALSNNPSPATVAILLTAAASRQANAIEVTHAKPAAVAPQSAADCTSGGACVVPIRSA